MREQFVKPRVRMRAHPQEDIGEVRLGVDAVGFAGRDERLETGRVLSCSIASDEEVFRPRAMARRARSEALLSRGSGASSRKRVSAVHCPRV